MVVVVVVVWWDVEAYNLKGTITSHVLCLRIELISHICARELMCVCVCVCVCVCARAHV